MSDETSKGKGPTRSVTDVSAAAERGNGEPPCVPGIEDSTPESLGMSPEEAQKLRNIGFTDAELARQQAVAKGQVSR
jgi:hypothetical protein